MRINEKYWVSKLKGKEIYKTNLFEELSGYKNITEFSMSSTDPKVTSMYGYVKRLHRTLNSRSYSDVDKQNSIFNILSMTGLTDDQIAERSYDSSPTSTTTSVSIINESELIIICQRLLDFFKQFEFTPSFRFINTLVLTKDPMSYVRNYFRIFDSQYANEIAEKIKSMEFKDIVKNLRKAKPSNIVNSHLEIFFGDPGGGKTTYASKLASKIVLCSSEMLPDAIMTTFDFEDGKASFKPSEVWEAIETGGTILLDEFNMLPYESIKFLQGITDNKSEFNFKGTTIKIHPDFKIIGTMNLNTENGVIPISAALADRASVIREFTVTAKDLAKSLL